MGVLRDILDLFVIREESKKRRVETQLAEAKLAEQRQLITIATKEEVERYDPKVRHLTRRLHSSGILSLVLLLFHAHQALGWRRRRLLAWVALLLLVAAAVVIYHR